MCDMNKKNLKNVEIQRNARKYFQKKRKRNKNNTCKEYILGNFPFLFFSLIRIFYLF